MIKCFLILFLSTIPALCGELQFGPQLGVLMSGNINGESTHPGPGQYWGVIARYPLSSLIAVEFAAGASLGMGKPPGDQLPGYPSYSNHDADFFATSLAFSVNPGFFSIAAGTGYYYFKMDWEQDLTGFDREWKTIELNRIGYHFSIGAHLDSDVDLKFVSTFQNSRICGD